MKTERTPVEIADELVAELDLVLLRSGPGAPRGAKDGRHAGKVRLLQEEYRAARAAVSLTAESSSDKVE
jgi:hypothetical protein